MTQPARESTKGRQPMCSRPDEAAGPTSDRGISRIGTDYGLQITVAGLLVLAIAFVLISYLG
jgi:hypothetical protein